MSLVRLGAREACQRSLRLALASDVNVGFRGRPTGYTSDGRAGVAIVGVGVVQCMGRLIRNTQKSFRGV